MRSILDHDGDGRVIILVSSLLLCHPLTLASAKPDTEQGSHHPLPAAKVLCLTALKHRPDPLPSRGLAMLYNWLLGERM